MKEISVRHVRAVVEEGLQNHFGRNGKFTELAGQLSIYPDRLGKDVTPQTLEHQCEDFSVELKRIAGEMGLETKFAVSEDDLREHIYLVPSEKYQLPDMIIDVTAGQYVNGHNHAFVGLRDELKDIVVKETGAGKLYALNEPADMEEAESEDYYEPNTFFNRKWGNRALIIE